ncbi:MAG: hypothetical protein ACI4GW_08100, partial [Lachnospiraceae bacterium]
MKYKMKNILFLTLLCLIPLLLAGCGVDEKEKNALFKSLKKENLIQVGEMDFGDYSDLETVSNAPVPGYTEHYTYEYNGITYSICFESYYEKGKGKIYKASVDEMNGLVETDKTYYFQKTKILKRMKLTDSRYSFYRKNYEEGNSFGIQQVYYNGSTVSVNIEKESGQFEDDRLFQCVQRVLNNPEDTPDIICNIGGQTYHADKVSVHEYSEYYGIHADF